MAISPASSNGINLTSVEAAPALAFIAGSVKDERGTPLVGAIVAFLEPQPRGREVKSVKTDAQGKFSTSILPGLYRLRASAEGFIASRAHVNLDRTARNNYDFSLKRTDTLVQKRGDSDDYRWIARSVPRHAMNLHEEDEAEEEIATQTADVDVQNSFAAPRPAFHGMMQLVAASGASRPGVPSAEFFGTNFAVSGTFGGNFEMAFIGQRGVGQLAPQRLAAIASVRPAAKHQVTTTIGYGQVALARNLRQDVDAIDDPMMDIPARLHARNSAPANAPAASTAGSLDQISVSTVGSWQVFQPLMLIYGFDYSRFMGPYHRESVLPRFAVQYSPSSRVRMNAAITPGTDQQNNSLENFSSENLQAGFETAPAEVAFTDSPVLDRSRRVEVGMERLFGEGATSVEASAFYDIISGHGVGVLALPLEASPETQATIEQVAHRVTAMNGAARGVRVMLNRRVNDHVTASIGYSFGRGERFNGFNQRPLDSLTPAQLFRGGFFQVASAKVDLDFTRQTGTRISTVIRLSPEAVVFAIDPFAGRMSVYDPNINIYVTQELPNFGLPVHWEAIVDARNLLDQTNGIDDGGVQLVTARTRRTVRGGLAFRW